MAIREAFARAEKEPSAWSALEYQVVQVEGRASSQRIWTGRTSSGLLTAFFESGDHQLLDIDVSQVVHLASATISNEHGESLRAVQVQCLDSRLDEVFHSFLEDVVEAVDAGQPVLNALAGTANEWRRLLSVARKGISEASVRGLHGELCILRDMVEAVGPRALEMWAGPEGERHDFVGPQLSIEVKTASLQNRQSVTIHGLRQLDPSEGNALHLAVIEIEPHPQGQTILDLVEQLIDAGVSESALRAKLASAGYVVGMPGSHGHRLKLVGQKFWEIRPDTPVLRRSALHEATVNAVSDLRYSLDLSALGDDFKTSFDYCLFADGSAHE
ncbi:PD-(D/E)XK motif protein [Micrococcus sp. NPDC078436]|uniref:PD-(D/E)XK motif protein n=1 Tax=Micrococcus sp. NPDC078436 TaxID=3154960 RepID=UPI00344CF3B6